MYDVKENCVENSVDDKSLEIRWPKYKASNINWNTYGMEILLKMFII